MLLLFGVWLFLEQSVPLLPWHDQDLLFVLVLSRLLMELGLGVLGADVSAKVFRPSPRVPKSPCDERPLQRQASPEQPCGTRLPPKSKVVHRHVHIGRKNGDVERNQPPRRPALGQRDEQPNPPEDFERSADEDQRLGVWQGFGDNPLEPPRRDKVHHSCENHK